MKKTLCSTAAAALFILALAGCAGPVRLEDRPPQPTPAVTAEPSTGPTGPVESEAISFSAGNKLSMDNAPEDSPASAESTPSPEDNPASAGPTPSPEPGPTAKPSAAPAPQTVPAPQSTPTPQATPAPQATPTPQTSPAPQETPAPAKGAIQFNVTMRKGAGESPAPSAAPEPGPTPVPPVQSEPPVETPPPAFSIDHWIAYAQSCARSAGLDLNPTATACWDNPITAGAHCVYLERDIQSRLNRYGRDESITAVWIWAEPRADGSYDLYIGYA